MANETPRIAAIVLAAGTSSRMGSNKLLADLHGVPFIRRTVEAVRAWPFEGITVVTGHDAHQISQAIEGLDVAVVHNPDYALGLSTSLVRGLKALPKNVDAALVCLGDMPLVKAETVHRLIDAFANPETICVPVYNGMRGNPVLWGRAHFAAMAKLTGDRGAKSLMEQRTGHVVEIQTADEGIVIDADTPEAIGKVKALFGARPA